MQAIKLYVETHNVEEIDAQHFNSLCESGYVFLIIIAKHIGFTVPQIRNYINSISGIDSEVFTTFLGLESLKIVIEMNEGIVDLYE